MKYLEDVAIPHPWYRALCVEGRAFGLMCVKMGHWRGEIGYALGFVLGTGLAVKMVMSSVI